MPITWSDCHIEWNGDVVARVVHLPTGVVIEPNEQLAPDADRGHLLEQIEAAVTEHQTPNQAG